MFCGNCGKELVENAVVCPVCGCWVNREDKGSIMQGVNKKEKKQKSVLMQVFLYLSFSFACVTMICSVLSIVMCKLYIGKYSNGIWLEEGWATLAWILGLFSSGMGTVAFVLGGKEQENAGKMISGLNFIFCISLFIGSFLFWVSNVA